MTLYQKIELQINMEAYINPGVPFLQRNALAVSQDLAPDILTHRGCALERKEIRTLVHGGLLMCIFLSNQSRPTYHLVGPTDHVSGPFLLGSARRLLRWCKYAS